ncbi:MAG TPA: amino acid adenylation domain-containing protein, partial [Pyrinomonadaceae bacterium]
MGNTNLKFLDEKLEKERAYWAHKLAGAAAGPGLPPDFKRPAGGDAAGPRESVRLTLDAGTAAKLFKLCGQNELLVFSCLVAALKVYLHKTTGGEDVVVGTAIYEKYAEHAALNKVLALRDAVRAETRVRELLLDVKTTIAEAFTHQKYPFDRVLDLPELEWSAERGPLFGVVALFENIQSRENVAHLSREAAFLFAAREGDVTLTLEYDPRLFKRETAALAVEHYARLLRALLDDPEQPVARLDLLSPEKRRELLEDFNDTRADYPRDRTIHDLFAAQAAETPDREAVVYGEQTLTYAELERRANRLAAYLRGRGVGRGSRVALMMEHAPEVLVAILGVLKAGGAYVPIDPAHPRARVAFILADAGTPVLLTQQHLVGALPPHTAEVVRIDAEWDDVERADAALDAAGAATAEDLAYVIYTSGSTGEPKGVEVAHRSLVNYICWARDSYLGGEPCACALYSSLAFDLTVTSVFMPLVTGNRVVVYRKRGAESPLAEILDDDRVDLIKLTPSHLSLIKGRDNRGSRVRKLIVGGEAFEGRLARETHESFGGAVEIYNEYGPTEATVGCMIHRYDPADDRAAVPVGRPAANARIYVLDERLRPAAENVVGDLYIAGDVLAAGYLNRPRLTAERFVADPFAGEPGARMYRSGDLARHLPGGAVEYIGRRDEQVKYHGHRVELSE